MSREIDGCRELEKALKTEARAMVLFYASWCPFCRAFLPVYEKHAEGRDLVWFRALVDEDIDLCDKYGVEVVPTVVFFENGKVCRRLDGVAGVGLNEKKLQAMIAACAPK
jgi:thioredoxin 1